MSKPGLDDGDRGEPNDLATGEASEHATNALVEQAELGSCSGAWYRRAKMAMSQSPYRVSSRRTRALGTLRPGHLPRNCRGERVGPRQALRPDA